MDASSLAQEKGFEIKAYSIEAAKEQTRPPRLIRVAVVQNAIVRPTTDPVKEQVGKNYPAPCMHSEDCSWPRYIMSAKTTPT